MSRNYPILEFHVACDIRCGDVACSCEHCGRLHISGQPCPCEKTPEEVLEEDLDNIGIHGALVSLHCSKAHDGKVSLVSIRDVIRKYQKAIGRIQED